VSCNPSHFPLKPLLLCFQSLPLLPFSLSPLSPLPPTTERISPLSDELAFTVETWNQLVRKVLMTNLHRRNFFIRKSSQIYCSVQNQPILASCHVRSMWSAGPSIALVGWFACPHIHCMIVS